MSSPDLGPFGDKFQERVGQAVARATTHKWRRRRFTFGIDNHEDVYRSRLPVLVPHHPDFHRFVYQPPLNSVRVDPEGVVYHPRWIPVTRFSPGAIIFGRKQPGRDYSQNPPLSKQQLKISFDQIPAGVDVALRRAENIQARYQPGADPEGNQTLQMLEVLDQLVELKIQATDLKSLDATALDQIQKTGAEFTERVGLDGARSPHKQRVVQDIIRGFVDSSGKKNFIAAYARLLSAETQARRSLEIDFPTIISRYSLNSELLRFERDVTRVIILGEIRRLNNLLSAPFLRLTDLQMISQRLLGIRVRPYVLGARKVVEHLGVLPPPSGSISFEIARRRVEPTVRGYLQAKDIDGIKHLLAESSWVLQRVLDVHEHYQTTKPSVRLAEKLEPKGGDGVSHVA